MYNKAYVLQVREKEKWYILDKKTFAVLGNCSDNYEIWKKDLESRRLETRLCTWLELALQCRTSKSDTSRSRS